MKSVTKQKLDQEDQNSLSSSSSSSSNSSANGNTLRNEILKSPLPNPEKEKPKTIEQIQDSYKAGLNHYNNGEFKAAEQEFVKVLKPVLSKSEAKNLYVGTEDVKTEALDSLYHLGQIYLNHPNYSENHAKAAALFQYCGAFAKKYEIDQPGRFIEDAYHAEQVFLSSINVEEQGGQWRHPMQRKREFTEYKESLKDFRDTIKAKLLSISDLKIAQISERASIVQGIYKDSTSFFVHQDGKSGLLQKIIATSVQQLGPPPCEYSIIGFGSLALGTMTPWSDLESAILIKEDTPKTKEYFKNLTQLVFLKVINLGESFLPRIGIEALNNPRTPEESEDWFWDETIGKSFSFDTFKSNGCKSPLGRQGGYKVKEGDKIVAKEDYDLIKTPEQLAKFQSTEPINDKTTETWFDSDKHLVQTLRGARLITGSQQLLDDYRRAITEFDTNHQELVKNRSAQIITGDVSSFSLKLGDEEEGKLIDVKKGIYRIGDRIIDDLVNYFLIKADKGKAGLTAWEAIDKMAGQQTISKEGAEHLKEALSIATELRLATYSHNKGQKEGFSTYEPAVDHLNDEQWKTLVEETFYIKDTSILHHFYYVMLGIQAFAEGMCNDDHRSETEVWLKDDPLYIDTNYIKGMVHARFLEYKKALELMEKAKSIQGEDLGFLHNLFLLYTKTAKIEDMMNIGQKIFKVVDAQYKETPNHPNIATSYDCLGLAYGDKELYDAEIKCHQAALSVRMVIYANNQNHPDIAMSLSNLGEAYRRKGDYDQAIIHHQQALDIQKTNQNHKGTAASNNNLGMVCVDQGNYDEAIKCHRTALDIRLKIYATSPNHRHIAQSYNNLGVAHTKKTEYDQAIEYYQFALAIRNRIYADNHNHLEIADSYDSLGVVYSHKGDYEKAMTNLQKALDIRCEIYAFDQNHSSIAGSYNNLGLLHDNKHNYKEAIQYYHKGLDIQLRVYETSPNHPEITMSYNNLGLAYKHEGNYNKAIKYYEKALEAYRTRHNHPDIVMIYYELVDVYLLKQNSKQAYEYSKKAFEIISLYENHHAIPAIIAFHIIAVGQLANEAFLNDNLEQSQKYSKELGEILGIENIDFSPKGFISLQYYFQQIANNGNLLLPLITIQKVLLKIDPTLEHGNHYHNLACYYAMNMVQDKLCEALIGRPFKETSIIKINPLALPYYLLAKYPQYLEITDTPENILKSFCEYCARVANSRNSSAEATVLNFADDNSVVVGLEDNVTSLGQATGEQLYE